MSDWQSLSFAHQLKELKTLQSMYNVYKIDESTVNAIESYLAGNKQLPKRPLSFVIDVPAVVGYARVTATTELHCELPFSYPAKLAPTLHIRTFHYMSRGTDARISDMLNEYLATMWREGTEETRQEGFVGLGAEWVSQCDHGGIIASWYPPDEKQNDNEFVHQWIYFHHLISQAKRRYLAIWAAELELTGYQIPGTPGFILIEGRDSKVLAFIKRCRCWSWKQMECVVGMKTTPERLTSQYTVWDLEGTSRYLPKVFFGELRKQLPEPLCAEFDVVFNSDGVAAHGIGALEGQGTTTTSTDAPAPKKKPMGKKKKGRLQ